MSVGSRILLLHAQEDDKPSTGREVQWASDFLRFFRVILSQIARKAPNIQMIAFEQLDSDHLRSAGAVVVILSPNVELITPGVNILRQWTGAEARGGGLWVGDKLRFFKVFKRAVDASSVFPEVRTGEDYNLFRLDMATGEENEVVDYFGANTAGGYWSRMVDLAYDVVAVLSSGQRGKGDPPSYPRERMIYLASAGIDMVLNRDVIARELRRYQCKILPDRPLPTKQDELRAFIRQNMEKCFMSLHILGEDYGKIPAGYDSSVIEIENQEGHEYTGHVVEHNARSSVKMPFYRLIWLDPKVRIVSERQRIFIEDIKSDAARFEEAEVLQMNIQEFKSIIKRNLFRPETMGGEVTQGLSSKTPGVKKIYLIFDKLDLNRVGPMHRYFQESGFQVLSPPQKGGLSDARKLHYQNLLSCDGTIIYYGSMDENWIHSHLKDMLKSPGLGRQGPLSIRAVYMAGDKALGQGTLKKYSLMAIKENGEFQPVQLEPFIRKINAV